MECSSTKNGSRTGAGRLGEVIAALLDVLFLGSVFVLVADGQGTTPASSLGASLLLAGLAYWASAFIYRTPLPVQPLKVLAFLCLVFHPTSASIEESSFVMGGILVFLGASGWISRISSCLTPSRKKMFRSVVDLYVWLIVAIAGFMVFLPLFFPSLSGIFSRGLSGLFLPDWFETALLVIPQIPVTLVNGLILSVEESNASSGRLQAERAASPLFLGERSLACSLGLLDILGGMMGAFPVCHGSGAFRYYRRLEVRSLVTPLLAGSVLVVSGVLLREVPPPASMPGEAFWFMILGGVGLIQNLLGRVQSGTAAQGKDPDGYWQVLGSLLPGFLALSGLPVLAVLSLLLPVFFFVGSLVPDGPDGSPGGGKSASFFHQKIDVGQCTFRPELLEQSSPPGEGGLCRSGMKKPEKAGDFPGEPESFPAGFSVLRYAGPVLAGLLLAVLVGCTTQGYPFSGPFRAPPTHFSCLSPGCPEQLSRAISFPLPSLKIHDRFLFSLPQSVLPDLWSFDPSRLRSFPCDVPHCFPVSVRFAYPSPRAP